MVLDFEGMATSIVALWNVRSDRLVGVQRGFCRNPYSTATVSGRARNIAVELNDALVVYHECPSRRIMRVLPEVHRLERSSP